MVNTRTSESGFSSLVAEDVDAIELCPCDEEDEYEEILRPRLPSLPICPDSWEPIVIYRKNKKKHRNHPRCSIHQPRIINKTGRATDFMHLNVPNRYRRYLRDISNTMVNGRWRWVTLVLVLTFSILWLLFGWLWMIVAYSHGDMDLEFPRNDTCTVGIEGFAGFLLMSIETQTTIGYGSRYPTENCDEGVFLLCLQMIMSIGLEGAVLGVFYVKMTRPKIRDSRKIFSKIAVNKFYVLIMAERQEPIKEQEQPQHEQEQPQHEVCQRDGDLCLMFQASDKDRAHIVGTQIRAYLTEKVQTKQGERVEAFQRPLKLESFGLLLWPLTIVHKIQLDSPLYDVSARDLLLRKFEIIISMIGNSDSTGQLTQSRTSYLASEIFWGHRFRPCVHYDDDQQGYVVHEEMLNCTEPVDTPLCSAKRLKQVIAEIQFNDDTITSGFSSLPSDSSPESPSRYIYLDQIMETDV